MATLKLDATMESGFKPRDAMDYVRKLCKVKFGYELDIKFDRMFVPKKGKKNTEQKVATFDISVPRDSGMTMNGLTGLITSMKTKQMISNPRLYQI